MTTNNFKPILFNTEMVQAILAGRKTQTRRIVNRQPDPTLKLTAKLSNQWDGKQDYPLTLVFYNEGTSKKSIYAEYSLPLCELGDILWVRETFTILDTKKHRGDFDFLYKASYEEDFYRNLKWKPSLFMPKEAARIFLKVTNVRCERLQDISEEDATSEGCMSVKHYATGKLIYKDHSYYTKNPRSENGCFDTAKKSFETLWDSINAKKQPWESNPWVWVYDFERIEKPENFI